MTPSNLQVLRAAGSNRYCVPACLSALLGRPVDDIMPLIHEHLGDQPISDLYIPIAVKILRDQGLLVNELTYADNFTVNQLSRRLPAARIFLTTIRGHAFVIQSRRAIDNSYPQGIDIEKYPYKTRRVEQCFEVISQPSDKSYDTPEWRTR